MAEALVERYDRVTGLFLPQEYPIVTWPDLLQSPGQLPPEGTPIYLVATIFDIKETMIRTLRRLACDHPGSYVNVCGYASDFPAVAEADPTIQPVINIALPPQEAVKRIYQERTLEQAFAAGFMGALLTDDYLEPIDDYPDREFFRYEPMSGR